MACQVTAAMASIRAAAVATSIVAATVTAVFGYHVGCFSDGCGGLCSGCAVPASMVALTITAVFDGPWWLLQ